MHAPNPLRRALLLSGLGGTLLPAQALPPPSCASRATSAATRTFAPSGGM